MATETQLVFIPFPIISHLVSAIQTAKLLVERDPKLSITVVILKLPMDTKTDDSIKNSLSTGIHFIKLPEASPELVQDTSKSVRMFIHILVDGQKDSVRTVVAELMKNKEKTRVAGFVLDMFCTGMIDVANELGIPSFIYFPSGASSLGLFFHIQSLVDEKMMKVKEWLGSLGDELSVPAYVHPVPVRVLPSSIYEYGDDMLTMPRRLREAKGILINTFCELEHRAISALEADESVPSVYPIGPVIQVPGEEKKRTQDDIMEWLDCQPDSSVVFLCFGSNGCFEGDQVKEIALALEQTAHRFLWSLRKPPPKETKEFPGEYDDPEEVLPEGFLQRTTSIGKVIGWAPQLTVLSHPAIGGFVSHCGWNSILESFSCGVPMAAWPLAAEQQSNTFQLVKELGIAVEIQMDYRRNSGVIVGANKIENAIRLLMDPDNEIREKVKVMQSKSKAAIIEGGSSYDALGCFLKHLNH